MKTKIFTLSVCFLLMANVVVAQDENKQAKEKSVLLDISAGVDTKFNHVLSLKGIFANEFNEHLSLGAGTGFYYNGHKEDNFNSFSINLPLFINIRGNIISSETNNIVPYYSLNVGYFFSLVKGDDEYVCDMEPYHVEGLQDLYDDSYQHRSMRYMGGLFFAPELGLSFNNMCIGIEFLYGTMEKEEHRVYIAFPATSNKNYSAYLSEPMYIITLKFVQKIRL